jgi:hypothetical protein
MEDMEWKMKNEKGNLLKPRKGEGILSHMPNKHQLK